jgi:hypothetical protein
VKSAGLLAVIIVLTVGLTACKNTCRDVNCLNGGSCDHGLCDCAFQYGGKYCDTLCPLGFEGDKCDVQSRQKFIRTWSAITTSSDGHSSSSLLKVQAGSAITYVNIQNFNNEGFNVIGIISGKYAFAIYQQNAMGSYTGLVSGSGNLNGDKLVINLTKENGINYFASCNP